MSRSFLPIFVVGLTAGCTGTSECSEECSNDGHDLDTTGQTEDTACSADCDTGETGTQMATFIGPAVSFTDADDVVSTENCTTHLAASDGPSYSVQTAEEKDVEPLTYTATFGDEALASEASDGLPLHTLANGWLAISPAVDLQVEAGDGPVTPAAPVMNLFVSGTWTCEQDGEMNHKTVTYEDGYILDLPSVSTVYISGMLINDNDGRTLTGYFESNILLHVTNTGGMSGDFTADCWAGNEADKP